MDATSGHAPGAMGLVVLGDSLTEGVGDPHGRRLRGWIHHLTQPPAPWRLSANLARTGARTADVRRDRLAAAVALAPAVATRVVGVDDVLDRQFDVERSAVEYEVLAGGLRGAAHIGVLAMTLHDLSAGAPSPAAPAPLCGAERRRRTR